MLLGGRVLETRITAADGTAVYANVVFEGPNGTQVIDARASDALNLALRTGALIRVAPHALTALRRLVQGNPVPLEGACDARTQLLCSRLTEATAIARFPVSATSRRQAATPGFNARAMVDRVLSDLGRDSGRLVLVIDDVRELAPTVQTHLTRLLAELPAQVHADAVLRFLPTNCACFPPTSLTNAPLTRSW